MMEAHPHRDIRQLLAQRSVQLAGSGMASDYAQGLLQSLGARVRREPGPADPSPATEWARSGLMALTGLADGAGQMCPVPLASCAAGVMQALACLEPTSGADALPDGATLLGERAAIAGLQRAGAVSPGGGCRLLQAADGWFGISLVREEDWSAVPAWLEQDAGPGWDAVAAVARTRPVGLLVEQARLLGLAASASTLPATTPPAWFTLASQGPAARPARLRRAMRVLDLSTLWSGPLCAQLLQSLGACVVKAESLSRPDGARRGPTAFYDLLNHGKHSVALDFAGDGVSRLRELIDWADVVIESARPRGLQQLGISAEQCVAARNGLTWISITGYGREPPQGDWIAFGDDAGIAAGLSALLQQVSGLALICGDAVADPLTGLHAALAALASHQQGGGHLLSLSLRDVVEHCVGFSRPGGADLTRRWQDWTTEVRGLGLDGQSPVARTAAGRARALGADTETVMAWLRRPC